MRQDFNAKSEVKPLDIAIIRIPRMSNFTDFAPLEAHEVIGARYVQSAEELHNPDMVIIPGQRAPWTIFSGCVKTV